jgi:hypothetical protein
MQVRAGDDVEALDLISGTYTQRHSIDRTRMLELQRIGIAQRFSEMVESIPMVAKLATRQQISEVNEVEQALPLLFEHTMYKSYPSTLLERRDFVRMTGWLDKLTSADLSGVDTSACDSIDSWLNTLRDSTELDVAFTSGTSGTMSFFPLSMPEIIKRSAANRVAETQVFGEEPTDEMLHAPYHFIGAAASGRESYTFGDAAYLHLRTARRPDADLLWLGARLRMAAARGDASKVDVPASLLARREELDASKIASAESDSIWLEEVAGLQGKLVCWVAYPYDLYTIASERLARGEHWSFAPGSAIRASGGSKGRDLPEDWRSVVAEFTDARLAEAYGMREMSTLNFKCHNGRYHVEPWIVPFVLDPDTSALLPRRGQQTGRFAFFDLAATSHWGGLMTGDEVEIDFDGRCECGATTQNIGPDIMRLSEKRGGTDKISCAATPEAYAEAMSFLTNY